MEHSPGVLQSTILLSLAAIPLSGGPLCMLLLRCLYDIQLLVCSLMLEYSVAMGVPPPPAISWRLALTYNVSPFFTVEAFNLMWCYVSAVLSQVPRPTTHEAPRAASCIQATSTQGSHLLGHLLHSLFQFSKVVISRAKVNLIHWIRCSLLDQQFSRF